MKSPSSENARFLFHLNNFYGIIRDFVKDKKKLVVLLIGLFGVLLIALSFGTDTEKNQKEYTLDEYKTELEDELRSLCESVEGAGKCRVTVTFSDGERFEYKGSNVIGSEPPRVLGVTVVCRGGDDPDIKKNISECMTALFDIGSNRVCVLKMK